MIISEKHPVDFSKLIDTLSIGIIQQNNKGEILLCNSAAAEILELSSEQLIGKTTIEPSLITIYPDGSNFPKESYPARIALSTGISQQEIVMGIFKPSGKLTWVNINSQVVVDSLSNALTYVISSFVDITEKKKVESKFSGLLESVPDGIIILDINGTIYLVNSNAERLLEFDRNTLLGESIELLIPEEFRAKYAVYRKYYFSHLSHTGTQKNLEMVALTKSGKHIPIEIGMGSFTTGEEILISVSIRDITKRKATEARILAYEQKYHYALSSLGDNAWEYDLLTYETWFSETIYELLGYKVKEITNITEFWRQKIHPDDRCWIDEYKKKYAENRIERHRVEYRVYHRDGSEKWVLDRGRVYQKDFLGKPLKVIGTYKDITTRKHDEELLRERESRFRGIFNSSYQLIGLLTQTGLLLEINSTALELGGVISEQVLGKYFWDCSWWSISPVTQKQLRDSILKAANGEVIRYDVDILGSNQSAIAMDFSIKPVFDEAKTVVLLIAEGRIITEQRRIEKQLINLQKQFQAFMEALPAMSWIVDDTGIFQYTNPLYNKTFNNENDLSGKNFRDMFPEEIAAEYDANNKIVFSEDKVVETFEPSIKQDGSKLTLKVIKFPLGKSRNKKILGGIAVDITELVIAKEMIRQAKEQMQLFVKHTPAAVAMLNEKMQYIIASDQWYTGYGLEGQNIIGKSHYDVFPEIRTIPHWLEIHQRCLKGDVEKNERDSFLRIDGKKEWLRWEIHPWKNESGAICGIIMFTEVITERIEAEEKLKILNEKLITSNNELEQFAYLASHDLQEPLRMVSSFLQLLEKKYKKNLDETATQYINFAVDGADRMKTLISDLLKFSRVNNTKEKKVNVDCNLIVSHILAIYKNKIKNFNASIHIGTLPVIKASKSQIEQLFQNLIGNALKYKGVEPPKIEIDAAEENKYWKFQVKDNGIGIDKKYFDKIFIIFQQLHGSDEYEGTGIGLAICKKIVELHGGKIWVDSEKDTGSIFYFTIAK